MRTTDVFEPDWALLALDAIARRTPTPAHTVVLRLKHKDNAASFVVQGGPSGTSIVSGEGPGAASIEADFATLLRIISGELAIRQAVTEGCAHVKGSPAVARALPRLFDLSERRSGGAKPESER